MACCKDFKINSTRYSNISYKIPCRYCMNCRIDRRNQWKARAEYEFKKHISGAFVTFTYDEINLPIIRGNDEKLRATLKKQDAIDFIHRLRKYIEYHEETQNILRQKNFTYLGVGEYGENGEIFNRPHFHILFFGLDFKYNQELFLQEWNKGFIDSLPILNGGIAYVLKYMDKQIMGKENIFDNYTRYHLEPPKQFQSKGFGSDLYYTNYTNIKENNGTIKSGMKRIPVPQYYKSKMKIKTDERKINNEKVTELRKYHKKLENPNKYVWNYNQESKMKEKIEREYQKIYEIRERNLIQQAINNGEKIKPFIKGR